jgi:hypothetical protein
VVKYMISGIAFLLVLNLAEVALSQACPQSNVTINAYLSDYNKGTNGTVAYAWTGAHWDVSTSTWKDRKNPTDAIYSSATGARVSQSHSSTWSHGAQSDRSTASAQAECLNAGCTTASLSTSACVTSKVDSAGAGAYARAGIVVPARRSAAKTGTINLNIPNRMTLTSNVGDESGVWGITVSVEKVKGKKIWEDKKLKDNAHPDIAPFLVDLLGLKKEKLFKVHSDAKRAEMFAASFELDPQGKAVKLIEQENPLLKKYEFLQKPISATKAALEALRNRFTMRPCPPEGNAQENNNCHVAEYELDKDVTIEIPYDLPAEPELSDDDQILYVEAALGGRDKLQEYR